MSYFDRIGGRYPQVPAAPNARNQQQQNPNTLNGMIRSAVWGQKEGALGQVVPFTITLKRLPIAKNAVVEVLFNQQGFPPQVVGMPMILQATATVLNGRWHATGARSGNISQGKFTFRVRVDNQSMVSNELSVVNDPVAQVMQRNNSDGFDR